MKGDPTEMPLAPWSGKDHQALYEVAAQLKKQQDEQLAQYAPYPESVIRTLLEIDRLLNTATYEAVPFDPREHSRESMIDVIISLGITLRRCDDLIGHALELMRDRA